MQVEEMWQFSLVFIQVRIGSVCSETPSTQDGQTPLVWVRFSNWYWLEGAWFSDVVNWQLWLFSISEAWSALMKVLGLWEAELGFQHPSDCRVWRRRKCLKVLADISKMVFPISKESKNYVAEA